MVKKVTGGRENWKQKKKGERKWGKKGRNRYSKTSGGAEGRGRARGRGRLTKKKKERQNSKKGKKEEQSKIKKNVKNGKAEKY